MLSDAQEFRSRGIAISIEGLIIFRCCYLRSCLTLTIVEKIMIPRCLAWARPHFGVPRTLAVDGGSSGIPHLVLVGRVSSENMHKTVSILCSYYGYVHIGVPRQLFYFGVAGPGAAPSRPASLGGPKEHEARLARNTMSNHTDMQDKYCGHCYGIHPIQSQYTKVAACMSV